jgi:alpha-amylase
VWTKFTFPGRNGVYSDFKWDWTNFHGTDFDAKSEEKGIYRFIGKEWDEADGEFGNYDYLMGVDLDMSDEEVVEELQRWGEWYFEFTGVDGVRLDAVKHIDFSFFKNWLTALREKYQKPIFAVGEYWNAELSILEHYIDKTEETLSLFDVPLHFHLYHASVSNGYYDMRYILKHTLLHSKPHLAVTFVDNHDTQPGQALESFILEWFKGHAYSLILLREEGYPCVFYGDYYGIPHNQLQPVKTLKTLLQLRKNAAYGVQHDYFNHAKIIGWTREGIPELPSSGFAVIMTVEKGGSKRMYVGRHFAGKTFVDALKNCKETVQIDEFGFGEFLVEDGSVSVWHMKAGEKANERTAFWEDEILLEQYETFGTFEEGVFLDNVEFSAYAEISDGQEPQLFYGSNYTHMRDEPIYEEENQQESEESEHQTENPEFTESDGYTQN